MKASPSVGQSNPEAGYPVPINRRQKAKVALVWRADMFYLIFEIRRFRPVEDDPIEFEEHACVEYTGFHIESPSKPSKLTCWNICG